MKRLAVRIKNIGQERLPSDELWLEYMPSVKAQDRVSVEVTHTRGGRKAVFTYRCEE